MEKMAESLSAKIYFAHPYASWERGLNENNNGLIRQYLPKSRTLHNVTEKELKYIMDRLNHRPRKTLGYRTPYKLFYKKNFTNCCAYYFNPPIIKKRFILKKHKE